MKRIVIIAVMSFFFSCVYTVSVFSNELEWWFVQHRVNQNGGDYNAAHFAMKDDSGDYILEDIVNSIALYDPDGIQIQLTTAEFGFAYEVLNGKYDANNGFWSFDDAYSSNSFYSVKFGGTLKSGEYHLSVTDNSSQTYDAYWTFNALVNLPIISSDTFCAFKYDDGSLMWKWNVPTSIMYQNSISTSVRTWIDVYTNGELVKEIHIKVPTHMGWAIVPNTLLQGIEGPNNVLKIGVNVRTNDNNNRSYSNDINWELANSCGCDIDGDQKIGIKEAINALQIVAGVR